MHFAVATFAQAGEIKKRLVKQMLVGQMVGVFDWLRSASLTDSALALKNGATLFLPFW